MERIQKVLKQFDPSSVYNGNLVEYISDEYRIRFVEESDYASIIELTKNVFYGNDFMPGWFFRFLKDDKLIYIGVEYVPKSTIICTICIKIMDNGLTGFLLGSRSHSSHRKKGLYKKLLQFSEKFIRKLYPKIKQLKATTWGSNIESIQVHKKYGYTHRKDMLFGDIVFTPPRNYRGGISAAQFEKKLTHAIEEVDNELTLVNINNVNKILDLVKNKYGRDELFIDWQLFNLNIGLNDAKQYLEEEIKAKRCQVLTTETNECLVVIYIDERPTLVQLHVYGMKTADVSLILVLNQLFKQWKNSNGKLQLRQSNFRVIQVYIDQCLNANPKINYMCSNFDRILITEKYFE